MSKTSKSSLFSRLNKSLPEVAPLVAFHEGVFSAEEYAKHEGIAESSARIRLRVKLLPSGVVRRVRTKRNGKLIAAWELVS